MPRWILALALAVIGGCPLSATSDEGMWLPNELPRDTLRSRYDFTISPELARKLLRASVRFPSASGGFVSPRGLVVTNHHVASDYLQKLSSPARDLLAGGFYAPTEADERKCPDLELNVLQSIDDVTPRVTAAVPAGLAPDKAAAARRAVLSTVEQEESQKTGLKCEVVTLYQGGLYHLYRYKKYTDVRLVFAPEQAIASFGGDVDNFEYPRHALDVCFVRAYENDKPATTPDYFEWNPESPKEGDLVFVTGHPGTTNRLETLAKLKHRRDSTLPYDLARLRALEAALIQYGEESPEQRRQAQSALHAVANSRKAFAGQLQGLLDPDILAQKAATDAKLSGATSAPFDRIAAAQTQLAKFEREYLLLERGQATSGELATFARHFVRLAAERPKPNPERLREYRESNLDSLKLTLLGDSPIYPALEARRLQTSLTFAAEQLGGDSPAVVALLGGKNPAARAAELVAGTKLASLAERRRLLDGGAEAIAASDDALIRLMREIDPAARALRTRYETEVEEPERQAYQVLAKTRFETLGKSVPPDATFTLRLAFGTVKGYGAASYQTTLGGAFARSELMLGREPFALPRRWAEGRDQLDLATPFDFASTADTIGGNSGSPVLDRAGKLVGVNFDRNRPGLVRNFVYTEVEARHVAVQSKAVLEVLRKLYGATRLADELTGK